MNQQELDALLVEVDMPRAVDAEFRGNEIKLRVDFAHPDDPIKIASTFGKILENPTRDDIAPFAGMARTLIAEQSAKGLVPYHSIASNRPTDRVAHAVVMRDFRGGSRSDLATANV